MGPLTTDQLLELAPEAIPLPHTTVRLIQLINHPDSTVDELTAVLEQDQALSARMLRVANSAYYGLPRQVTSLHEAIVLLGRNALRGVVFTASVVGVLGRQVTGYSLGPGALWRHSISVARAARHLAERAAVQPDEAYVGGLLHDIGKVVLDQYMQEEFGRAMELAPAEAIAFDEAERRVFGVDHAAIGGALADHWELPPMLVDAIRCHHRPADAKVAPALTAAIHVADIVCLELGVGIGREGLQYAGEPRAFSLLSLEPEDLAKLTARVADDLDTIDPAPV